MFVCNILRNYAFYSLSCSWKTISYHLDVSEHFLLWASNKLGDKEQSERFTQMHIWCPSFGTQYLIVSFIILLGIPEVFLEKHSNIYVPLYVENSLKYFPTFYISIKIVDICVYFVVLCHFNIDVFSNTLNKVFTYVEF